MLRFIVERDQIRRGLPASMLARIGANTGGVARLLVPRLAYGRRTSFKIPKMLVASDAARKRSSKDTFWVKRATAAFTFR